MACRVRQNCVCVTGRAFVPAYANASRQSGRRAGAKGPTLATTRHWMRLQQFVGK